ncbi:MAG TPA: xanthine dehydrogenase family protein subunit M [Candidatus Cybelea sp.]|nr:xanthine dehydrogenase family protein subunit M [Candidatus Cybelea sp.]
MIPAAFEYHRPASLDDAVKLLAQFGDEARVVAGGHSLIPMMKLRLAAPGHLVDLQAIGALKGIKDTGGAFEIGAMVTQRELILSAELAKGVPILKETAEQIADPQVRYVGTLGGNVANGDPGNDMPAVMMALDAVYLVKGPGGARELKARGFYHGAYATALKDGEILTAIRVPKPPAHHGSAYQKQKRKIGDYATAAAAVILTVSGGKCTSAAVALTNVGDTPLFADAAGAALVGTALDAGAIDKAAKAAMAIAQPARDARGPVEFRRAVAGVMVRRAIEAASKRAR